PEAPATSGRSPLDRASTEHEHEHEPTTAGSTTARSQQRGTAPAERSSSTPAHTPDPVRQPAIVGTSEPTVTTPLGSQPSAPAPRRLARPRARLDEHYLDDAGIVLLWPFLERFYGRLGLLDERRGFLHPSAREQAIALLELLATGELDPPEHRLPLAKLLCGVAPDHPFALDEPLAEPQVAEAERLLSAVIDNAPILGAMPIPSFRAAFLQRPAALSIRDGTWLLRVERRSHDVVLDRFEWSWSWIRLPWMPDPLQVEW
ncbi:MAG TPA: contractile injection system tape measure protein, partial [Enhygromyxa sp.]|nr:contractile injection system tape measure protein [Enhygromyxa sp.]